MHFRKMGVALACACAIGFGAFAVSAAEPEASAKEGAAPVATIGDKEVVTKEEFEKAVAAVEQAQMAMMRQRGQADAAAGRMSHEQKLRMLDSLIDSRIVLLMAREAAVKVDDAAVQAEIDKRKTNLPSGADYDRFLEERGLTEKEVFDRTKERLLMKAYEEARTTDVTVTDEEVKAQFEKLKERGIMDDFDVQHILIKASPSDQAAMDAAKTKIDAVYERLTKGEDFAAVAKEVSEDAGSKENGGAYKNVRRGQMVPEFDSRMAAATVGDVSEPFASQYGWHILKVTRHDTGELTPDISERIKKQMLMAKQKMAMRQIVQDKRSTLNITISLPAEAAAGAPPAGDAAPKKLDSLLDAAS